MVVPGRSYAWEGERMPHQRSSADGEPSSSGRLEFKRSGSSDLPLRSLAQLPRSSRNGSASLPMEPAEDVLLEKEEQTARRTTNLKARPPNTLERASTASTGRRARRGSIADFLGFKSGGPSQESSAAPSRDITLHGMAGPSASGARSRRSSFLNTFGIGTAQQIDLDNEAGDAGAVPLPEALMGSVDLTKSLQPPSQGRRRRASMLDIFRSMQSVETSVEGGEAGPPQGDSLARTKSSSKSRRASVIDFFRSSNTGLTTNGDDSAPSNASMNRRLQRGESAVGSRAQRRRSVIDILGHSSKKVLAKLMNHEFDQMDEDDVGVDGKLWFTSLNDFKPLTFKYLSGRYSSAFFACSVKTGQHYILKKFDKGKMNLADERGVRRALHFAEVLEHEHIVQCCGLWEDEQALYIVEEYAVKGDLLQDSMSHPEKYTEAFMATKVIKPLLDVLAYLHSANVVHRAIFPEYVMFGREDKFKLGHFTCAIDQRVDSPTERIPFLDYMAPEMLSVRSEDVNSPSMPSAPTVGKAKGRAARLPASSNDGSALQRSGPPPSGGTPVFDFGNVRDSRSSQQQQQQQQPGGPPRRPASTSGAQLLELFGLSGHTSEAADSGEKCSPISRTSTRSTFNLFRSSRRPSPQQQQQQQQQVQQMHSQVLSPSDDGNPSREASGCNGLGLVSGTRRLREESPGDAPRRMPTDGSVSRAVLYGNGGVGVSGAPARRRKSAVDEMSAPWLRPVGSDAQYDFSAEERNEDISSGYGKRRSSGGSDDGDTVAMQTPVVETTSAGATADGSGESSTAAAASGCNGCGSSSIVGDSSDAYGGSTSCSINPRPPSHMMKPSSPPMAVAASVAISAQLDSGSDHSPVEKLSPFPKDSLERPNSSPLSLVPQTQHQHQNQNQQQQQQRLAAGDSAASPSELTPPQRQVSSCRRSGAAHQPEVSTFPPGSPARTGGSGSSGCGSGTPLSPPLPRPCSALGSHLHRPGSAIGPAERADSRLDRAECLPGYAAERLTHHSSNGLRSQSTRLHSADSAQVPMASAVGAAMLAATGAIPPGPVMESLMAAEQTLTLPYDGRGAAHEPSDVKRVRATVSFTAASGAADAAASDSCAADSYVDDGRGTRSSRMASREPSTSSGQAGQVMMGLRTMARHITVRIGMVLGGRGDLLSPGASHGDSSAWGDAAESGGGGARDPSPRPSCPGAGEATAIIMPNNPWEWQEHYNEKVDLWQVGCLVHEILCLSLPFETEDKLLACALILWADIVSFPDHLSPECHDFMRACLTKNPAERPSAAELLQHPWIVRHAAGEVLKSVRQHKDDESLAALSNAQQLTVLQRAATAVGLGWMVGAGAPAAAAGTSVASSTGTNTNGSPSTPSWNRLSWLLRPWTSKVVPAADGGGVGEDVGDSKLALAMAMVQEQQQQQQHHHHHQHQHQQAGASGKDRSSRRKSSDVEAARRSLEIIRQHQHQQHLRHPGAVVGAGSPETPSRWEAMI
ncbi:hypothetical protein VaNZ11_001157 [Volvox africanus]|uniref:Protein kinase domain-containing protein n=1 Tax=Volvox africanus TaxID=51714 RepID=A0ABQ5RP54_9CHLO|nr:hypothetical protein VaNZ11_001157 [Volvox africanus]